MKTLIRILYLEDDPNDVELVRASFKEAGLDCRITVVQDRDEFEEALRQDVYDIILADYRLPRYDGMSALRSVKELWPDIPFIFVSGTMGEEAAIEALTKGATDYVLKQNLARLVSAVQRALQEARNRRDRRQAEIRLNEQLHFLQQLLDSIPIPVFYKNREGLYLGCNAAFEDYAGLPRKDIVGKTVHEVAPEEFAGKHHEMDLALLSQPGVQTYEVNGVYKDGKYHDVIFHKATFVDANGRAAGTVGALMDVTELKRAEREHLANLRFIEIMDRGSQAIQKADSLEQMMKEVLDIVLSKLDCDRVYLMHPCDPGAASWTVPMERSKPGYAGDIYTQKLVIPMEPTLAEVLQTLIDADGPVTFGPRADHPLSDNARERYGIKSMITMALFPRVGKPWQFGVHRCSHAGNWTSEEKMLVREMGRRLEDALSSLLAYRDLQESEERYRLIAENTADTISVFDLNLKPIYVSPSVQRLRGYTVQEAMNQSLDQVLTPGSLKKAKKVFNEQLVLEASGKADPTRTVLLELEEYHKDGSTIWVELAVSALRDDSLQPSGILTVSRDITERKRTDASIRKLSQAIEQSPVSIVITDLEGNIEFVNAKFTQITGYTYDEALEQNPRFLKSGETATEEYTQLWKTITSGGVWQGEFHNRKKNGELFWEQATIAPVRDADNVITHYVAVKEDITERKKLEDQLRQTQKMEAVGQLAGGVAHDFNNILGVIIGHAELALEKAKNDDSLRQDIEQILEAGFRSSEITRQLLAFARKQTIAPKILDLNKSVEGMLKLLQRLIGEDIELLWLPGSNLWPVKMDPSQIDQILANLCVNARDAISGVGKISIETNKTVLDNAYCTEHEGFSPGEYVMMAVSDNGSGMDKRTIDKIFEPFFTTKGLGKGTGLGLATVYGIVKQNNGFINAYSEPEHGSTFKIYLPRHTVKAEYRREENSIVPPPRGHETILVVEDESTVLETVKLMLENLGYTVLTSLTPSEAMRIVSESPGDINLLITDLVMPEMSGLDLMKSLTSLCPELKCLFMSGYSGNVITQEGVLEEGVNFIQKPFSRHELADKVREALDSQ